MQRLVIDEMLKYRPEGESVAQSVREAAPVMVANAFLRPTFQMMTERIVERARGWGGWDGGGGVVVMAVGSECACCAGSDSGRCEWGGSQSS